MSPVTGFRKFYALDIDPVTLKCRTIPLLRLDNSYSRAFHLAWLGFFVAFLSWFAFPPLIPEAIKSDLKLTPAQIGNSNIISLLATFFVRIVVGVLVDNYGPRKVMAGLLLLGAIPSGLVGTVSGVSGLYTVRFFIGLLGGTFVPCQAWTTTFFSTSVVGRANALVGGWGNAGGGMTFIIMVALYDRLRNSAGISAHAAWRVAFVMVPVPILVSVAIAILVFGQDHPVGKWCDRGKLLKNDTDADEVEEAAKQVEVEEKKIKNGDDYGSESGKPEVTIVPVIEGENKMNNMSPSFDILLKVLKTPQTYLPALAYLTSFGFELAIDANLANVLFGLYSESNGVGQTKAGYITASFGLMNVFARPFGGYIGDVLHRRFPSRTAQPKRYMTLLFGFLQGALALGLGLYLDTKNPSLTVTVVILVILAFFNEAANGLCFSLVPHCNPYSNGIMTGLVGAMGNVGGIIFTVIFRFQPMPFGKAFWISGVLAMGMNALLVATLV